MFNRASILSLLIAMISALAAYIFFSLKPPSANFAERSDRVISGVTIINPGSPALEHQSIVIQNGIIADIRPAKDDDPAASCPDCFVMPGLIDAHIHSPPKIAFGSQELFSLLYLKYGVTSVRDTGQSEESVTALKKGLNSQTIAGPRMYNCGPVIDGNPPGWPFSQTAESAEEGVRVVSELANSGVDCIKVYNELSEPAFVAIATEARNRNIPLIGHVPHSVGLTKVHDMEVQHLAGIPYVDGGRPVYGRDYSDGDVNALKKADIKAALDIAKRNDLSFTPTLSNYELRLIATDQKRFPPSPGMSDLPDFWHQAFETLAWHPSNRSEIDARLLAVENSKKIVKAAHNRGIDILAGTDTIMPYVIPGESLLIELDILGGIFGNVEDALVAATRTNGRHIDENKIGVLRTGAYADMLILKSDPRTNLGAVRKWNTIVVGGRFITRAELDRQVTKFNDHFDSFAYRTIMSIAMAFKASDYAKEELDEE